MPWLVNDAPTFFKKAAGTALGGEDPSMALSMINGMQQSWAGSDKVVDVIDGKPITGKQAAEVLNGGDPFGIGSDAIGALRQRLMQTLMNDTLSQFKR
jgi:hypothetical protein